MALTFEKLIITCNLSGFMGHLNIYIYGIPGARTILRRLRTSIVKRNWQKIISIHFFLVEDEGFTGLHSSR